MASGHKTAAHTLAWANSWRALPAQPGTYALLLRLRHPVRVQVGRLGQFEFPRGWYIYVGSARGAGGLRARARHHWQSTARPHWHLDFLRGVARPVKIAWQNGAARRECRWARNLATRLDARMIVPKFGASDCHCPTHLYYCARRPNFPREPF